MPERRLHTIGNLIGKLVTNENAENLGKLEELVIDMPTGRVTYAVLSFGGLWGMGAKLFAIPWEELSLSAGNAAVETFILRGIDREMLAEAPYFRDDAWPDMDDPQWVQSTREYYRSRRMAR